MTRPDLEQLVREALRRAPLDPPLRPDLEQRVRLAWRRRRRLAGGVAALAVAASAALVVGLWHGWPMAEGGTPATNVSACEPVGVSLAVDGRQFELSPTGPALEIDVLLGDDLTFTPRASSDACDVRLALDSHSELLVSRTIEFPDEDTLIATAAGLGAENATVTAVACASPRDGSVEACGKSRPVAEITVHVVSNLPEAATS